MSNKKVKKIEIEVTVTKTGNEVSFKTVGFTQFEILGLLRLYEQQTSIELLRMTNIDNPQINP